ncbi:MAG: hypothetical protein QME66_06570 [Candidatus Eisenbacteria bacterium]|nr:hypothetical protein [Candidatus Eisenbacteria bacterium]
MEDAIGDVSITGDFTMIPGNGLEELERTIVGAPYVPDPVKQVISDYYHRTGLETPGVATDDYVAALGLKTP